MPAFDAQSFEEEKAAIIDICSDIKADDANRFGKVDLLSIQLRSKASPEVLNDEEVALACVGVAGWLLEHFSEGLRAGKGVVLAAVKAAGHALDFASEELRGDKEVVLAAAENNGQALAYASEEFRGDKDVVLAAADDCAWALGYASEELRGDKEVALAVVSVHGQALEYVSEDLRCDKEVVLVAVSNYGRALEYASNELRRDKELVFAAVNNHGEVLEHVHEELQRDKEVVLAAVSNYGQSLQYADAELRGEKEVVLAAVYNDRKALDHASKDLTDDKAFLLLVARCSTRAPIFWYCFKAGPSVQEAMSREEFASAAESLLAVPGQLQPAPLLLVTLKRSSKEDGEGDSFHARAVLGLSGEELVCDLPVGSRPNEPVVNDLAKEVVRMLRRAGKMDELQKHVFINFCTNGKDDPIVVTPWDCQRPLSDFLFIKP